MKNLPHILRYFFGLATVILAGAWFVHQMGLFVFIHDAFDSAVFIVGIAISSAGYIWQKDKPDESTTLINKNRAILIDTVQQNWIEGVLDDALRDAQFGIEAKSQPQQAGMFAIQITRFHHQ